MHATNKKRAHSKRKPFPMKLLYFPSSQPSRAVLWFVKRHNIEVELEVVDLRSGQQFSEEHTAKNLFQSVPVLQLDDGYYLSESSAILNYLAVKAGVAEEYPVGNAEAVARVHEAQLRHDTLARFVTTTAVRPALALINPATTVDDVRGTIAAGAGNLEWALKTLNTILGQRRFVGGDSFTVADYVAICELNQMPALEGLLPDSVKLSQFPNVQRYLEEAKAVPLHDEMLAPFLGAASKFKR